MRVLFFLLILYFIFRKDSQNKNMRIEINSNLTNMTDGVLYIKLSGDIDHHTAKEVRDSVDNLIKRTNPVELELDLSDIEFMDSSGLGLVLGRYKKQTEMGGKMKILNPTKRVMQILQLAGVEKIIKIERIRQI